MLVRLCRVKLLHVTLALAACPDQTVVVTKSMKHFSTRYNLELKNSDRCVLLLENRIIEVPLDLLQACRRPVLVEVLAKAVFAQLALARWMCSEVVYRDSCHALIQAVGRPQ